MTICSRSKKNLTLLAIVVLAIVVRITAFNGFGAVDDAEYARFAHAISIGKFPVIDYQGPAVFPLRLGIILPTALLFKLFGVHEWSMVGFSFATSILGVLVSYLGARLFFGVFAGLIGATLWALLPIDSFHASILVPDPAEALFSGAAVLLLVYLFKNPLQNKTSLYLAGYLAGLMFGYSWLCKTSLVYLFPFCLILCVLSLRKNFKRNLAIWIAAIGGLATMLVAELLFYNIVVGDALFRLHSVERNISGNPAAFDLAATGHLKAIIKRIVLTGPQTILTGSQFLVLPLLALLGGAHAVYWKDRSFRLPMIWLLSLIVMFNFSSISLKQYIPLLLFERYLYPLFLPAVIITAGFIAKLCTQSTKTDDPEVIEVTRERSFWVIFIVAILVIIAGYKNYKNTTWYPNWTTAVTTVSKMVTPKERVYTDILSIHGLEFFWQYPQKQNTIEFKDIKTTSDIRSGSYILINATYLDWLKGKAGWWPNLNGRSHQIEFKEQVPDHWQLIWQGGNAKFYKVMAHRTSIPLKAGN